MKFILILILVFFFALSTIGQTMPDSLGFTNKAEAKNLIVNGKKEGKWCEYFDYHERITGDTSNAIKYRLTFYSNDKPQGIVREYTKRGRLFIATPYNNGLKNGTKKTYMPNGMVSSEAFYVNGKLQGIAKEYFDNGKVFQETPWVNDSITGINKEYYDSGTIKVETTYKNTVILHMKTYYKNGKMEEETVFEGGAVIKTTKYDENGNEIKEPERKLPLPGFVSTAKQDSLGFTNKAEAKNQTVNGLKEGRWIEYYDAHNQFPSDTANPKLYRLCVYAGGNLCGTVWWYYKSGKLESEDHYKNGKENGLRKDYYENGKIKMEDSIKDWESNGLCRKYYPDGKLEVEYSFVKGKLMAFKEYDSHGKTLKSETLYNYDSNTANQKSAIEKYYFKKGGLMGEVPYTDHKINGIAKDYYENGVLLYETPYISGERNGIEKGYYNNGKLKEVITYNNDTISNEIYYDRTGKEMKNGVIKNYWLNGKIESEAIIKNGKATVTKSYDEDGKAIDESIR